MYIILGSGCRESIIIKHLKKHNRLLKIICISDYYNKQIYKNVNEYIKIEDKTDYRNILNIILKYNNKNIIVIPGSEIYLKDNLVNLLIKNNINVIGPVKQMAYIETSKSFCREFLKKNNFGKYQPKYKIIKQFDKTEILNEIIKHNYNFVIKPDGLYGGKGVRIYNKDNYLDSLKYCKNIIENNSKLIIEEKLYGEEFVLMSFCDGLNIKHMPLIKDYKDLNIDNETKTGGMGSIILKDNSFNFLTEDDIMECHLINEKVMLKLSENSKIGYRGILYGSFIQTENGIKIIEYNARFGDSECLNVITLLKTPLDRIFKSIINNTLNEIDIEYYNENCICKYIVPKGYPLKSVKDKDIKFNIPNCILDNNIIIGGLYINDINNINEEIMKTTGSRICCVIDRDEDICKLKKRIDNVIFNIKGDIHYRKDIGNIHYRKDIRNINNINVNKYKDCGVDIEEGDNVVKKIKNNVMGTFNDNVIGDFGDYCGFYNIKNIINKMDNPILVSSIDGVGTKTKFIIKYLGVKEGLRVLAHDIVNHCVNDIIVKGAIPLYITDYIANNKIISNNIGYFIEGLTEVCKKNNVVLMGGETAELPNTYLNNTYEIVGHITGIIDKKNIINGKRDIREGDYIYGLRSNGIHTNGYSIINKLYENLKEHEINKRRYILDILLKSHKSYLKDLNYLNMKCKINGYCHITGGGYNNIERILDDSLGVNINIPIFEPFAYIQNKMNITDNEMYNIFNCGYGMLVFVNEENNLKIKDYKELNYLGKVIKRNIKRINIINNYL